MIIEIYEYLKIGGIVMIPIFLGSIIAIAIFIERLWALRIERIVPVGLLEHVLKLVKNDDFSKAKDACLLTNSPAGRLLKVGLEVKDLSRSQIKERFEEVGRKEVASMDKFVETVGTIASVEPLLGLLGTVTGMIGVFKKVVDSASSGAVDPSQLAGGIWQALLTTAAGLSVAIVAFLAYRFLQSKNTQNVSALEECGEQLLNALEKKQLIGKNNS